MMYLIYTTLILLTAHSVYSNWLDPHDMNREDLNTNGQPAPNFFSDTTQYSCPSIPINFSMAHYKRLINLILSTVVDDNNLFTVRLHVNLPQESYAFLKGFATDDKHLEDPVVLREVDRILSRALAKPYVEHFTETANLWADRIYFTVYNRTTLIYLSCLFVLFISYKLLRANLNIWSVVKYLLFLGWVTDFAFTWINLLHEAEINKMADSVIYESMPPYCNPNKMTIWQYLKYSLSSTNECRNYHQTMYKDNFWSVAPVRVLSHQFGMLIYTPATLVGQALGSFTSGLLSTLPWGVNIILLPFLLVFSATIMCIAISFLSQTSFRINLMHLLQLEFGNDQRRTVGDVLSGHNLNRLLNVAERNMVEDVRQNENARIELSSSSNVSESIENLMVEAPGSNCDLKSEHVINKEDLNSQEGTSSLSCGNTIETNSDKKESSEKCDKEAATREISSTKNTEIAPAIETVHDGDGDKF